MVSTFCIIRIRIDQLWDSDFFINSLGKSTISSLFSFPFDKFSMDNADIRLQKRSHIVLPCINFVRYAHHNNIIVDIRTCIKSIFALENRRLKSFPFIQFSSTIVQTENIAPCDIDFGGINFLYHSHHYWSNGT